MQRRRFLQLAASSGTALTLPPWMLGCSVSGDANGGSTNLTIDPRASTYGHWVERDGLPAFVYNADQESLPAAEWDPIIAPRTRRHWLMVGNRAIRLQAANDGTVAVFDESYGLRWLVAPDPRGTGVSSITEDDSTEWGTDYSQRAGQTVPERTFGPTWFEVRDVYNGLTLERTILCPEGEVPWLLIRVRLRLAPSATAARTIRHVENWQLRPRFLNLLESEPRRRTVGEQAVQYDVRNSTNGIVATESFESSDAGLSAALIGPPATLMLEPLGGTDGERGFSATPGEPHAALHIDTALVLTPGEQRDLWFRFGRQDDTTVDDPARLFDESLAALAARVPRAASDNAAEVSQDIPWHMALLTGGLAVDHVLGGHSLDQGSSYSYLMGFNGAARDPLQHALPLVYTNPDLALSVLRNTCAWAKPNGDLPYALNGAKQPTNITFRPSDQNLWALWLAAEYAAATGDLAAFDVPLAYHPVYGATAVPLREHLRRQFRFFIDFVARGEGNHVRILNADWNDVAIQESGVDAKVMIERGGSVLNSAMASWVLSVFAGLAMRLGETVLADEARAQADELRSLVAQAWNGRWFHRAYAPGVAPVGDADCWLEVQPWAMLCGAATEEQARSLLDTIDFGHRAGSPLGARVRWPANEALLATGQWGDALRGGIWYSIQMTLVWAAAHVSPALGWDEWRRMSLGSHTAAYPDIWEGTLSGSDAWNGPESLRPGRTWGAAPLFAMQAFPVNNMHSHSQPLLAYLRLLGVEPTGSGALAVGDGGSFHSASFRLNADGHGELNARGEVVVETRHGMVQGGAGAVRW
jgi:hypothetical protein